MLYTLEAVKANLRNREGKRVFYLGEGDCLTPGARDYLTANRIPVLSAREAAVTEYRLENGGFIREKPEHMTHLNGDILVEKTHPRIAFRGIMDSFQAEMILCQLEMPKETARQLEQLLELSREIIACDVLEKPLEKKEILGLSEQELRSHSHRPQDYYGQPHFMPSAADGAVIARLNRCRCAARRAELAACHAFRTSEGSSRPDILQALNRMSSAIYLLMIREKAKQSKTAGMGRHGSAANFATDVGASRHP